MLKGIMKLEGYWKLGEILVFGGILWTSGFLIGLGTDGPVAKFLEDKIATRDKYIKTLQKENQELRDLYHDLLKKSKN